MSTDLTDLMHRATDGHDPDLTRLAHEARRRGLGIRRRRQALGLVGAAAATALVLGGTQVAGDTLRDQAPSASGTPYAQSDRVRADGRTTAAALQAALQDLSPGEARDVQGGGTGADPGSSGAGTVASLRWTPSSGADPTRVEVHVRPTVEASRECGFRVGDSSCELGTRSDGSRIERLRVVAPTEARGSMVLVQRTDGTEVVVSSLAETATAAPLGWAELEAIAADPAFGPLMDDGWTDPALLPADYRDLGRQMDGTGAFAPDGHRSLQDLADELAQTDAQD
ncbi:hypothetical protein [Nocardioides marmoraquaticus]